MSYLNPLRLHFAGTFQASVSTVNNDPEHFDNATFLPSYQEMGTDTAMNGWWNPVGDAAWRLLGCKVTSAFMSDGSAAPSSDPVLAKLIADSDSRVSAKLVDLDPEQQMVSMIYGMQVRIINAQGKTLLRGDYEPAAFMDIWARTMVGGGDACASAMYQSVLTKLQWGDVSRSPFLTALKAVSAADGLLSIKFNVDQYKDDFQQPNFTRGRIVGTIGPASAKEPKFFVPGRQLTAETLNPNAFFKPVGLLNFSVASVDEQRGKVLLDLGNALPTKSTTDGAFLNIGDITLKAGAVTIGTLAAKDYAGDATWYNRTAGVVEWPAGRALTKDELDTVKTTPLNLSGPGIPGTTGKPVASPEVPTGEYVRADQFVFRMNPSTGEQDNVVNMRVNVSKFGKPWAGQKVAVAAQVMGSNPNNLPITVTFPALSDATDDQGFVTVPVTAADPGNPRDYLDGQLFALTVLMPDDTTGPLNSSNFVSILVWDKFTPENPVTWNGQIHPIFQQYANLYPIMKRFMDMANYDQVCENAELLAMAFDLDPANPNSMPVTRDLSQAKRRAIVGWLRSPGPDGKLPLGAPPPPPPHAAVAARMVSMALPAPAPAERGGKTAAIARQSAKR